MPLLNPFLRALFQSSALGQALPPQNYVVLLPTSDSLLNARDSETNKPYSELVTDEDFLGSHVLRVTPVSTNAGKDTNNVRDGRGKARTYPTVNGRTVIIKESLVYSNKGFKNLTQAQLLTDTLYYSSSDNQQWLIYLISKPLLGAYEPFPTIPAVIKSLRDAPASSSGPVIASVGKLPKKKDIKTFGDVLNHFPMIARQMQPGLDRIFNEFGKELGKPLPPPPSRTSTSGSLDGTTQVSTENGSVSSGKSNGSLSLPLNSPNYFDDEEDLMCRALETAVTAAIDLFQTVDKQQLSFLGATTDLTGPTVERLIEIYIAEQVHQSLVFPRLCNFYRTQDGDLDRRIRQMECLDVSQVGIEIDNGRDGKRELLSRLNRSVAVFRRMGVAGGPQAMLKILLETQKTISEAPDTRIGSSSSPIDDEKRAALLTVNADVLVSLLLIIVIRSQVRHLQARLSYMQHFIFIEDVDSGEMGYALSTLEAVLTYLSKDAGGLRKAAQRNKLLWEAVKTGNLSQVKSLLEESNEAIIDGPLSQEPQETLAASISSLKSEDPNLELVDSADGELPSPVANLSHVFPFQTSESVSSKGKRRKKVHLASRSLSISSSASLSSRTATIHSALSGIEGDVSVGSLVQTQDAQGNSILMMAIEHHQTEILKYLLGPSERFPPDVVISDTNVEGTTLLSAAIQLGHPDTVDVVLDYVSGSVDERNFVSYLAAPDERGRTAAHYLFNTPQLMSKLSEKVPWRQKDKNGQTPLFALCRSYDHPNYASMVTEALISARAAQGDGQPLRLDEHTDNRGNTLLHIINNALITSSILQYCDADPNAVNDKKFTPLMLASKYGRIDMVRVLFGDPRVDQHLKELRGLTAVELAKDDEVRNRIDDLTLFASPRAPAVPDPSGRITTIVRSFFVEDGSTRFIIKSGAQTRSPDLKSTTYTITTCRRSLQDFENLTSWLRQDHPASYLPTVYVNDFRSPFQIHSRPSRAVLCDTQTSLDRLLKIMLAHPTFGTHETLWEFFLVPDMQGELMASRAKLKAQLLTEKISEEYDPLENLAEVEQLISHSRDMIRKISAHTRNVVRHGHNLHQATTDLAEAVSLASTALGTLGPPADALSPFHASSLSRYAGVLQTPSESSPLLSFVQAVTSFHSTILAIQISLLRPSTLISRINDCKRMLVRDRSSLDSQSMPRRFQFPGMEESRQRGMRETERRIVEGEQEIERLGRELNYTREVVLGELAGWEGWREQVGRSAVKEYVKAMVVKERERGRGLERCLRALKESGHWTSRPGPSMSTASF